MYEPQVNDYVIWNNGKGVEGWVYFKCNEYVTIEQSVRPKDYDNYVACDLHRNERLLILCYSQQWNQLTYLRSRESIYEEEKENNSVEMVGKSIRRKGDKK